jgi:hypothetical protein
MATETEQAPPAGTWDKFKPAAYEKELGKPLDPAVEKPPAQVPVEPPAASATAPVVPPVATPPVAAPAEPTTIPDTDDDLDPGDAIETQKQNPKTVDFKRTKTAARSARQIARGLEIKRAELERAHAQVLKQLEEVKKTPASNPELINQLTKERDEALAKFNEVAFDFIPEVQQKFEGRKSEATAGLKAMVKNSDEIIAVLEMPEGEKKNKLLNELMAELGDLEKGEINATNRDLRRINNEYSAERKKANEAISKIASERTAKQQAAQAEYNKHFEEQMARFQDAKEGLPGFVAKSDADKPLINERIAVARQVYSGQLPPQERARMAALAAVAPELTKQLSAANALLAERDATINQLQGAGPTISRGGSEPAPKDERGWGKRLLEKV